MAQAFRDDLNRSLDRFIHEFYERSSIGGRFRDGHISLETLSMHTIQTILRIRLARVADAKLMNLLTRTDPVVAAQWSQYMAEEMLHDRLFLSDLKEIDPSLGKDAIYATEPFESTKKLQGYLYYTLEHNGPLGVLSKSYFLEYTSGKTQPIWNARISSTLGHRYVRGAVKHDRVDAVEHHTDDVWASLDRYLTSVEAQAEVKRHCEVYKNLFHDYFDELGSRCRIIPGNAVSETRYA